MDDLTHRTGITATGHRLGSGSAALPPSERHANRAERACATMAPQPGRMELHEEISEDGRRSWPAVVQYQVMRWDEAAQEYVLAELVDLPPTFETHPDPRGSTPAGGGFVRATLPYKAVVHDLPAYERLKAHGLLGVGHITAPEGSAAVIDNRSAPGA